MNWISVKEQRPPTLKSLMVYAENGGMYVAFFTGFMWYISGMQAVEVCSPVTHWTSLPEPPKNL